MWTTFTLPWESKTFRRDTLRSFLAFRGPLTFLILYARMSFEVNYKVFEKKIWNGKVQLHFQQKYYDLENGWWLWYLNFVQIWTYILWFGPLLQRLKVLKNQGEKLCSIIPNPIPLYLLCSYWQLPIFGQSFLLINEWVF